MCPLPFPIFENGHLLPNNDGAPLGGGCKHLDEEEGSVERVPCHKMPTSYASLRDMLTEAQREFLNAQRVAHLATADASGAPHVVPVCFAVAGTKAYFTVDDKPKRRAGRGRPLSVFVTSSKIPPWHWWRTTTTIGTGRYWVG